MSWREAVTLSAGLTLVLAGVTVGSDPLPADASMGPRFEDPELSASVTYPQGWIIEQPFGESHGKSPDGLAWCALNGSRLDEPVEDPDALLEQVAEIYPALPDDGPLPVISKADPELPAGRSIRLIVDLGPTTPRSPEDHTRFTTTYLLTDAHRIVILGCWSDERADDDWLAVAETIELAPVDP